MRVSNKPHHILRSYARLICYLLVLAFAGMLVDIDHPLHYFGYGNSGRFLMPYFTKVGFILLACGTCFLIACLCRYVWIRVLKTAG